MSRIFVFLIENPELTKVLLYAVKWEEDPENKDRLGWNNWDVHAHRRLVNKLVFADIARVSYHSSKHMQFLLMNRDEVKSALELIERDAEQQKEETKIVLAKDLFSIIVGYEDIKATILSSFTSEKPVSCLLVGPVATAKSLFLEELNRISGSSYHLGSSSTKAGLTQFLLSARPLILLIDELDKMNRIDYAALLSLMESGKVVETKYGRRSEEHMKVWVFATCNRTKGIPPENLSRFPFQFHLRDYTRKEYADVVYNVLTEREGVSQDLAEYIAETVAATTRDVRKAVGIGRVCKTRKDVDQLIETLRKYKGF